MKVAVYKQTDSTPCSYSVKIWDDKIRSDILNRYYSGFLGISFGTLKAGSRIIVKGIK